MDRRLDLARRRSRVRCAWDRSSPRSPTPDTRMIRTGAVASGFPLFFFFFFFFFWVPGRPAARRSIDDRRGPAARFFRLDTDGSPVSRVHRASGSDRNNRDVRLSTAPRTRAPHVDEEALSADLRDIAQSDELSLAPCGRGRRRKARACQPPTTPAVRDGRLFLVVFSKHVAPDRASNISSSARRSRGPLEQRDLLRSVANQVLVADHVPSPRRKFGTGA